MKALIQEISECRDEIRSLKSIVRQFSDHCSCCANTFSNWFRFYPPIVRVVDQFQQMHLHLLNVVVQRLWNEISILLLVVNQLEPIEYYSTMLNHQATVNKYLLPMQHRNVLSENRIFLLCTYFTQYVDCSREKKNKSSMFCLEY